MFNFFTRKPPPARESLLSAVPVRNDLVQEGPVENGKMKLTAPLTKTFMKKFFGSKAMQKAFEIDELGAEVWRSCNGRNTVEAIITAFARQHQVNIREAEVAVSAFLKTLIKRNLVALVGTREAASGRRVRKNRRKKK